MHSTKSHFSLHFGHHGHPGARRWLAAPPAERRLPPAFHAAGPLYQSFRQVPPPVRAAEYGCYHPLRDVLAAPSDIINDWIERTNELSLEEVLAMKKK